LAYLTGYECNCDYMSINPCGGCDLACRTYRDQVVHWHKHEHGKHWHMSCAFKALADAECKPVGGRIHQ
jgi:hypothetical protein